MKKIVVLDGHHYPPGAYDTVVAMCQEAKIEFAVLDCETPEEVVTKAYDADAALCIYVNIDDSVLSKLPKLKMVVRCGIGVDNLNLADFTNNGVYACNVPDYGVEEVAIHALGLMLALERKIPFYNGRVHKGEWLEDNGYAMRRISLRTIGLLGFGRIARKFGGYASALGYSLIAYDPFLPDSFFEEANTKKVDLDDLFKHSDVLVVMAPATEETAKIINDANLLKAKDGLFLINTSRGALVDTASVIRALDSGKVAGVGFDVLEEEPPGDICQRLFGRENVIITPHIAYRSQESFEALKTMAAETAINYLKGRSADNIVNKDVIGKAR